MAATLKEIARKANVSMATVSLALNKKPGVGQDTREKILKIAEELDYTGNKRDLIGANTKGTIRFLKIATHGHTVNRDHDVFIADYIEGVTQGAQAKNFNLEINSLTGAPSREFVESIATTNVAGIAVLGTELSVDDITVLGQAKVPVVFLDTFHDFLDFDFVDMNNVDSVYKIVLHLVENGHREIGFVRSGVHTHNFQLRDIGFHRAVEALDIPFRDANVYTVDSTFDGAYKDMLEYLKRRAKMPTALFCTNDIIAYGCIKALRERGYKIPEDISVVGFDDLPLSSVMEPPLTTMQVLKKQIGQIAISRLTSRIASGNGTPSVKIQIAGELIIRKSVRNLNE